MVVIIIGAGGYLGRNLVRSFSEEPNVKTIAILRENEDESFHKKYSKVYKTEIINLNKIVNDFSVISDIVIFHLAWGGVNGDLKKDYNTQLENIKMSLDVVNFAKSVNAMKLFVIGTVAELVVDQIAELENPNMSLMYAVAKRSAFMFLDMYAKNIKVDMTWLQLANIYGPNNTTGNLISYTIKNLSAGLPADFGNADQPYDFLYIDDLMDIFVLLSKKKVSISKLYIGSGSSRLLSEYLQSIGECFNKAKLIRIGKRNDDGIKYDKNWFDIKELLKYIGKYNFTNFEKGITNIITSKGDID